MKETLEETMAQCCKVCGAYKCKAHRDWVICSGCPSNAKYDPKVHPSCPYCGKSPKG